MNPAEYEKIDNLLMELEAFVFDGDYTYANLEQFFETMREERGISYNQFVDALEWTEGPETAANFDTYYWHEV